MATKLIKYINIKYKLNCRSEFYTMFSMYFAIQKRNINSKKICKNVKRILYCLCLSLPLCIHINIKIKNINLILMDFLHFYASDV